MEDLLTVLSKIKPCDRDRPYIYIIYSAHDKDLVWRDVLEFQRRGYNIWLGEEYVDKRQVSWQNDAMEDPDCKLAVFYVSAYSLCSDFCYRELSKIREKSTCALHNGPLKFIVVDVEEIGDIVLFKDKVLKQIGALPGQERYRKWKTLNGIMTDFLTGNNERVRIHPKNEENRRSNYYDEILLSFPKSTKIYAEEAAEEETAKGETAKEGQNVDAGVTAAAEDENAVAGESYDDGRAGSRDYEKAMEQCRKAAERGRVRPQPIVSLMR